VVIRNVTVDGYACDPTQFSPPGCPVRDGSAITFDVAATDTVPLASLGYEVFFPSSQTTRSRTVLVGAGQLNATTSFDFTVSSNSPERVDLVATETDENGRAINSPALTLDVRFTAIGYGGHSVSDPVTDPLLVGPVDVTVAANGDWIVLSQGNGRVLTRPAAGGAFSQLAAFNDMQFITRAGPVPGAGVERYYVSRPGTGAVYQLELNGTGFTAFAALGGSPRGLAPLAPLAAKGWVDVTAAVDADTVTLTRPSPAASETYEFDTNTTCVPAAGHYCVAIAGGATAAQKRDALVASMTASSGLVNAVAGTQSGRAVLQAKSAGETGDAITLAATGADLISASTLLEGHWDELYVGTDMDALVRRYNLDGGPFAAGVNHGTFNTADLSYGVAVRDNYVSPSTALADLLFYTAGEPNGFGTLRGRRVTVNSSGGGTVTQQASTLFQLTQTTTTPNIGFGRLWDVALSPAGCLLVSDQGNGTLYAADVRDPTNTSPAVELVAAGFNNPRGIGFDANGNLLVADSGRNAIYVVSPTPSTTDCF